MGRLFLVAWRNVLEHRRRSLTLGIAIALVTMLLVLLVGISQGMQETMLKSATTLVSGHVNLGGFFKPTNGSAAPIVVNYSHYKALIERELPELDYVIDRTRGFGRVSSPKSSQFASIAGVNIEEERGFAEVVQVVEGSAEGLAEPGTVMIFESHADVLDLAIGDMLTITAPTFRGVRNAVDVRVVAIAKDVGFLSQLVMFTHTDVVRDMYQLADNTTGAVMLYLKDRRDSEKVAQRLRRLLEEEGRILLPQEGEPFWRKFDVVRREAWTGQRLDVTTWEDEISMLQMTIAAFDALSALLVGILLSIIVIGIMNSLLMAIRERTSEIGTLRAIGMSRFKVLMMFVLEAFILTAMATAIGAALGVGVAGLLNAVEVDVGNEAIKIFLMRDTLSLSVDMAVVLRAMVIITSATTIFALLPAWRAARMKPITAIHHAG